MAREVLDAIRQSHTRPERLPRLGFVRGAVKILREHHVFDRGEIRHQMKLLKNKSDLLRAKASEPRFVQPRDVRAVHHRAARGIRLIEYRPEY